MKNKTGNPTSINPGRQFNETFKRQCALYHRRKGNI
jgi:hypothetical protein